MWGTRGFHFRPCFVLPLSSSFSYDFFISIRSHTIFYADDIQIYPPMKPEDNIYLQSLIDCVSEVKTWMVEFFFLQLNDSKTEVLVFGRPECAYFLKL